MNKFKPDDRVVYVDSGVHGTVVLCYDDDYCVVHYDSAVTSDIEHPLSLMLEAEYSEKFEKEQNVANETGGFQWMHGNKPAKGIYFNDGGKGIAIVAIEGAIGDWAAYIGSCTGGGESEKVAYQYAASNGVKLPTQLAQRIFPEITNWRR